MNTTASAPKASLRNSGHIHDYTLLPAFVKILSHGESPSIELHKAKHKAMAAMATAQNTFFVLSIQGENGSTAWFHLIEQGKRLGLGFAGAYTCTAEILHTLLQEHVYEKDAIKANKLKEEERLVLQTMVADSTPIDWLKTTVARCLKLDATDIHFEVQNDYARLRIRRDGIMRKVTHFPSRVVNNGLAAGYTILAEEGSRSEVAFNSLAVQSAMIPLEVHGQKVLLRYQSHPTVGGYDAIMRVLRVGDAHKTRLPSLEGLGYTRWQLERIQEATASAWGGVFVAGITGSGKTTTLSSLLSQLAKDGQRKIISIEDPVEYQVPGVNHFSIRRKTHDPKANPFEEAMLAFLRMDPDVGMFGEIRDQMSGHMAHAAIQTGHKLLTTVHATSALGIIARLTSQHIGLIRDDVCTPDFLSILVYQVLVPKNCVHCSVPALQVMDPQALAAYEKYFKLDPSQFRCASDSGCTHCQVNGLENTDNVHVGVHGVKVCAEVIPITTELMHLMRKREDIQARELWLSQRQSRFDEEDMLGKEAWGHALYEMSRGVLDPYHFERTFGPPAILASSRNIH